MQALWISTLAVAIAEIGDKTQLLSLVLAARYRRPWPIIAAIALATVLNHALAAWIGASVAGWFTPTTLRWAVAASFLAVALWALKPDAVDESETRRGAGHGAFVATLIAFFLAEIGDKTQIATLSAMGLVADLGQEECDQGGDEGPVPGAAPRLRFVDRVGLERP